MPPPPAQTDGRNTKLKHIRVQFCKRGMKDSHCVEIESSFIDLKSRQTTTHLLQRGQDSLKGFVDISTDLNLLATSFEGSRT
jgi:hypothetical protein